MSKSQVKESFCYSNNHIIKIWEKYLKTHGQNLKFTVQDPEHNILKDVDTLFTDTEGNKLNLQHEIALAKYKNSEGADLSTIILSELKKDASDSEKVNVFLELIKNQITGTINIVYPCHVDSYHWNLGVIEINQNDKEYYIKLYEPLDGTRDEKCNLKIVGYNYKSSGAQGSKYDIVKTKQQNDLSSCGVIAAENGKAYLLPTSENNALLSKSYNSGALDVREEHLNEMELDLATKQQFLDQQNKVGNYTTKGDDFQGNKAEVQQKLRKILALEEFTQNLENSNNINNIKQILLEKARESRDINNLVSSLLDENHNWHDGAIDCFNNLFGTQKSINTPKIIESHAAMQGFIEYIDPLTYLKFTNTCKHIYQKYGIKSSKVYGFNKDGKQFFQENISKNVLTAKDAAAYCLIDVLSYKLNPNSIQDRGLDFNSFNLQKVNKAQLGVMLNTPYIAREFNYKNILKITQMNQSKINMQQIIKTDYVNNKAQILPAVSQELWNKSHDNADIIFEHINNQPIMSHNQYALSILLFNILTEKPELLRKVGKSNLQISKTILPDVLQELWNKSHDNADIILEHINNQITFPHNEYAQSILLFNILTEKPELLHKVGHIPQDIKAQILPAVFQELWNKSHDNADIIFEHINNQPMMPHNELHYKSILENILTEKPELFRKLDNINLQTKNYLLDALKNTVNLKQFNEEHLNVLLYHDYISDDDYINILGESTVVFENTDSNI